MHAGSIPAVASNKIKYLDALTGPRRNSAIGVFVMHSRRLTHVGFENAALWGQCGSDMHRQAQEGSNVISCFGLVLERLFTGKRATSNRSSLPV